MNAVAEAKTTRTFTTSRGETVETTLTDIEALTVLAKEMPGSEFAQSLVQQYKSRRQLSPRQWPWVFKLAEEQLAKAAEPKMETISGTSYPKLVSMLHGAREHRKHPRIVAEFDYGVLRLSIAGERSRFPGAINVTSDGPWDHRRYYGRIDQDSGEFAPSRECPDWVMESLADFNEDPAKVASLHGQRFGNCCFCSRELTDERSLEVGYGPVCAGYYGLPWG